MKYTPLNTITLKEHFEKNIVMDMNDLLKKTGSSRITILRHLKEIGYLTSYNHNGKYFAVPEFLAFNETGLFNYKGINFYKNGGLQDLIIDQINTGEKGYTVEELSNKLKTGVGNQLRVFAKKGQIIRKKYSDVYIYYSKDETKKEEQITNREREIKTPSIPEDLETSDEKKTIKILLEIIKNPNLEPQEIGKTVRENGLKISDIFIESIFEKYGIQKKGSPSN